MKTYEVVIKNKAKKGLYKLPVQVQKKLVLLAKDLRDKGPVQASWPNYSKLGKMTYHCHLGYSYSACWRCENEQLIIEVYYVGSREDAPY